MRKNKDRIDFPLENLNLQKYVEGMINQVMYMIYMEFATIVEMF